MSAPPVAETERPWRELPWDSRHFGLRIGRLTATPAAADELHEVLAEAARSGVELLYWTTADERWREQPELAEYGGRAVSQRVTFESPVEAVLAAAAQRGSSHAAVREFPVGEAGTRLEELALIASQHSRFRLDERLPGERCDALYRLWVQRSARREIANVVLTAAVGSGNVAGLITVAAEGDAGVIGLVAVAPESQGQGVGRALVAGAAAWIQQRSLRLARVTTQGENLAAVRLYRGTGFTQEAWATDYHFWLGRHDG